MSDPVILVVYMGPAALAFSVALAVFYRELGRFCRSLLAGQQFAAEFIPECADVQADVARVDAAMGRTA